MKRYGEKELLHSERGTTVRENAFYTLNAGYRVYDDNHNMKGYITFDLFCKLIRNGTLVQVKRGYDYTEYLVEVC